MDDSTGSLWNRLWRSRPRRTCLDLRRTDCISGSGVWWTSKLGMPWRESPPANVALLPWKVPMRYCYLLWDVCFWMIRLQDSGRDPNAFDVSHYRMFARSLYILTMSGLVMRGVIHGEVYDMPMPMSYRGMHCPLW